MLWEIGLTYKIYRNFILLHSYIKKLINSDIIKINAQKLNLSPENTDNLEALLIFQLNLFSFHNLLKFAFFLKKYRNTQKQAGS